MDDGEFWLNQFRRILAKIEQYRDENRSPKLDF